MNVEQALPTGWTWIDLENLANSSTNSITDGPFGSKLKTEHYTASGPRVLRLQNIGDGIFRDEKAHISESHFSDLQKHRVFPGDLIIAALGEQLPRACITPAWIGPAIVKADCVRFKPNDDIVQRHYLCYALNAEPTRRRASAIIHGVGRPRLNLGELKSIQIPLAPLAEQRRIVARIEELFAELDEAVAELERVRANLKRYRAAVLRAAVSGELTADWRAKQRHLEPASVLLERILTDRRAKWEADQLAKFAAAGKTPPKGWQEKYAEPSAPDTAVLPVLPERWCWTNLEQLTEIAGGITKGQKRGPSERVRSVAYLRVANVQRGYLDPSLFTHHG